jgi:hypothetical protein
MAIKSPPQPSRQFLRARSQEDVGRSLQELYDNQTRLLDFGVPPGTVLHWFGPENAEELGVVPRGYLLCFGQVVGQAEYPALYELIGDTYNAVGGTTVPSGSFRLPDLRAYILQFSTKNVTDNAGQVGEYDNNMTYTTGGASRLFRFFILPLIRVG